MSLKVLYPFSSSLDVTIQHCGTFDQKHASIERLSSIIHKIRAVDDKV